MRNALEIPAFPRPQICLSLISPGLITRFNPRVPAAAEPLDRLTRLLGQDVFFVPCEWGTKRPIVSYTDHPFANTQSRHYRALFKHGRTNIAVYLGKASGGLCAIDFDDDKDLEIFLKLNPRLATTTRSRGSRGGMIWMRVQGEYPKSCNPTHRHFEWRADRRLSTICGRHPKGMEYRLVVDGPPLTIHFPEIVWPDDWELPWKTAMNTELEEKYGKPYYLDDRGRVAGINEAYWAGLYALESEVCFQRDEKAFYRYNPESGLYEPVSEDSIRHQISSRMLEASRQSDTFDLEKKRTARILAGVISHLRGIAETDKPFREPRKTIHLANGVIVFNELEADLRPFSKEFRSRHRSPLMFDSTARCDRFLNELVLPAVHPEDVELLQKFAGMFLLGYKRAQRILILDGEAGRGKTQFANVMQHLVGMANVTQLRTKHLAERFELFRFLKRTLLVGVDVEPDFLQSKGAAVLKGLVGGDWFDAEQKGGTGSFQLQGVFNVLITSNARLRVRLQGDVGAWRRRLSIVRYEAPPPSKKIPDFGARLVGEEGSGILNWALIGAEMLLKEIPDEGGDFILTPRQCGIVDSLLAESESLRYFLMERVSRENSSDVTVNELVEAYGTYCPERRWQALPITEVHEKLEGLMLDLFSVTKVHDVKRNDKCQRGFKRVRLAQD